MSPDEQLVQNIRAAFDNFLSTITTAEAAGMEVVLSTNFRAPELLQFNQTIKLSGATRGCVRLRITKSFGAPS